MGPCSQHCLWCNLPQLAFYRVLELLDTLEDVLSVSQACNAWHFLARREAFWSRYLELRHLGYRRGDPLPQAAPTHRSLARLLNDCRPDQLVCSVSEHTDEVLHVAAPESPAGEFFATSSKDGTVRMWPLACPTVCHRVLYFNKASLVASLPPGAVAEPDRLELVSQFDWQYCQYVEFQPFNAKGSVILISGAKREAERGEIAIYDIARDRFLSRAELQPYDVFGCFFDSYHYLSGTFEFSHINNASVSRVLIHRTRLLTSNERLLLELRDTPESEQLLVYTGQLAATVRRLVVAQGGRMCLGQPGRCAFRGGRHQTEALGRRQYEFEARLLAERSSAAASRRDPAECRCREKLVLVNRGRNSFLSECVSVRRIGGGGRHRPAWIPAYERHLPDFHGGGDRGPDLDPCHSSSRSIYSTTGAPAANATAADEWEVTVGGHVVGMCLSPDHRFLYVNVRPWLHPKAAEAAAAAVGADWAAAVEAFELSEAAEIHVLDLLAWRHHARIYTGHKGFTPSSQCFFLFLDAGSQLVCSGSEDCRAHVWDRTYGTKLCTLSHESVVNCCALSAAGLLVTVSDDRTVKVWSSPRSRRIMSAAAAAPADCCAGGDLPTPSVAATH